MPATLKNISKMPVTVILDHPAFLNPDNGWQRSTAEFARTLADGTREKAEVRRSIPGSLMLLPGESKEDLHPAIEKCRQVSNLIKAKVLTVTITEDKPPAEKKKLDVKPEEKNS